MIFETLPVRVEGSADYARLSCYIWSDSPEIPIRERPLILILPGGGYHLTTDREAEPVAIRFMAMGYHTAVLRYSVAPWTWPVSLKETGEALRLVAARADRWHIDRSRLILLGFSAGGHLAASYAEYWRAVGGIRPAGLMLGYPVISSDKRIWHEGSIRHLLGERADDPELLGKVSLEKHVTEDVPPVFLWNTKTDDTVPPENSEVFAEALKSAGVRVRYLEYPQGGHGLSLANELSDNLGHQCFEKSCQDWVDHAGAWLKEEGLGIRSV